MLRKLLCKLHIHKREVIGFMTVPDLGGAGIEYRYGPCLRCGR